MTVSSPSASLGQSISNLWYWLHTWEDESGGIHGPVVYHHRDNLKVLRPDTWTQGATILGLLNAYDASGNADFLESASRLGRFLIGNYLPELHVYRDSNFDQKPLGRPALEGNSLASFSLLELANRAGSEGKAFESIAKDNVMEFVTKQWDAATGSFAVTYHGAKAHIHNKSAMAILSILACEHGRADGEMTQKYAIPCAKFLLAAQVKEGRFAGAFPYADNDTNYRTLYSLVVSLSLMGLYKATGSVETFEGVEKLLEHLSMFVDQKTGLICHYHKSGYPQWITDTILYYYVRRLISKSKGVESHVSEEEQLQSILAYQYPSGAFPLSLGFEDLWYKDVMGARPEINRWRDVLPTPGMNSWNFWFLSAFLPGGSLLPPPNPVMPFLIRSDREEAEGPYQIADSETDLSITSTGRNEVVLLLSKKEDVPKVCEIMERSNYWKTVDSIMRYPTPLRRIILAAPRLMMKLRR